MSPAFTFLCIIIASTFLGYVFATLYYLDDPKHTVSDINKLYCIEDKNTIR